jgi:hypothetical protein
MGLLDRLFGKAGAKPASPRARTAGGQAAAGPSTRGASPAQAVRKELVRVSVRETLLHNGIPGQWIRAEPLTTSTPGREAGVHVRLVVQHWDARLMHHAVALQEHVEKRILAVDPLAEQWLMGLSWQFDLDDVSRLPPMPHPGSWTAPVEPARPNPSTATPAPDAAQAGVISGPTRIQNPGEDRRKALERMLSERDADFRREEKDGHGFSKTEPMGFEKTQPMSELDKAGAPAQPDATDPTRRPPRAS